MPAKRFPLLISFLCAIAAADTSRSAAPADLPGLPEQEIGANDLLSVSVYDAPELSKPARVDAGGELRVPLLRKPVAVAGLLPGAVARRIAAALAAENILVDPVVTISVLEYQSRAVSVAGAVRTPVTFQMTGRLTLIDALNRAGGLREDAGPEILVRGLAGKAEPQRIAVKRLLGEADPAVNYPLRGGEEIAVPESGKVYVVGNVRKPGAIPVRNASETSVLQVLALTEGLAPFANKRAYVYRPAEDGAKQEIVVELDRILRRRQTDFALRPDDILYIPDNRGRRLSVAALERVLSFGSTAGATALVYSGMR